MTAQPIAALVLDARPDSGHVVFALVLLAWLLLLKLAVVQTDDLEDVLREAIRRCLLVRGKSMKEAAFWMQMDPAHLSQTLTPGSKRVIPLDRLLRLPWDVWAVLLPELAFLAARRRVDEIRDTVAEMTR